MELKFKVDDVLPFLLQAQNVIPQKASLPILEKFVIDIKNKCTGLSVSDGETWLDIIDINITNNHDGHTRFCVDAKTFVSTLKNLQGCELIVSIDTDNNMMVGKYGYKGTFTLPIDTCDEYPEKVNFKPNKSFVMPSQILTRLINETRLSIGDDELRPVMNGIHFDFTQKGVIAVSSDGHRLIKTTNTAISNEEEISGFNLPKKPAQIISSLFVDGDIGLSFNNEMLCFTNENTILQTRMINGRYPNYNAVIPNVDTIYNRYELAKNDFLALLNRIQPLGNKSTKLVALEFDNATNELNCSVEDLDWSTSSSESMPITIVKKESDEKVRIGFNGTILSNMIGNISCENITICVNNPTSAAVICPTQNDELWDYTSILMPLMLNT
jgi:DNA polymerase-3 subunit beta